MSGVLVDCLETLLILLVVLPEIKSLELSKTVFDLLTWWVIFSAIQSLGICAC